MGSRGTKPKPTAIKLLEGTRADRVNLDEPKAVPGRPDCPDDLDDVAKAEWNRIIPDLEAMGVLSKTDSAALALYCDLFSEWKTAKAEIKKHGLLTKTQRNGFKTNPAVAVARYARVQMARLLTEFGCTPSSRSRVNTSKTVGTVDPLDEFRAKRKG